MEILNSNLKKFKTGQVSPGNGLSPEDADIATAKLDMEAEDKANEAEEKKANAELFDEINSIVEKYKLQTENLKDPKQATKENLIDSIEKDLEIISVKIKNSGLENSEEINKLINKLTSIKELFENSL